MRALQGARERDVIALSDAIFDEIADVLRRPKFSAILSTDRMNDILELLTAAALWFAPEIRVTDCQDPDDNKYLELAVWSGAAVIVSSDRHLLSMHPWRGVGVLSPAAYVQSLG